MLSIVNFSRMCIHWPITNKCTSTLRHKLAFSELQPFFLLLQQINSDFSSDRVYKIESIFFLHTLWNQILICKELLRKLPNLKIHNLQSKIIPCAYLRPVISVATWNRKYQTIIWHHWLLTNWFYYFFSRLTLFIASSSFIILTLITIIGAVSCFILCNEDKDFSRTQRSFIQSMSSSSNLNLNLIGQNPAGMQTSWHLIGWNLCENWLAIGPLLEKFAVVSTYWVIYRIGWKKRKNSENSKTWIGFCESL